MSFFVGHLPDVLSLIHVTYSTPVPAIIFECLLSLAMLMVKDVYKLINYLTFAEFLFIGTLNVFIDGKYHLFMECQVSSKILFSCFFSYSSYICVCVTSAHLFACLPSHLFLSLQSFIAGIAVSVIPYLRWKRPNLARPVSVPLPLAFIFLLICSFLILVPLVDGETL